LVAALIHGADDLEVRQAMSIASVSAGGLIAAFGTMSKCLQVGRTASDGVLAADLACKGFTGPVDAFGHSGGFTVPFIAETIGDWSALNERWGRPFAIAGNAFKPHASCMITHPAIDAAITLKKRLARDALSIEAVERIACRVNPLAVRVAGIQRPQTGLEGKFSVGFCIALGFLDGRATPDCFTNRRVDASDVLALLKRMEIIADADVGEQQASIEVTVENSTMVETTRMARGQPANPLSDADLSDKFRALVEPQMGARTEGILNDLWMFGSVNNVSAWFDNLGAMEKE
jgi:2-methylcitrate dehydratase PrpD